MIKLYQFPISHYCEKVRWALAFKKLDHQIINLLPGFHSKHMIQISGQHSVPVLVDNEQYLSDSTKIINYLDAQYPIPSLTPTNSTLKQEAMEWERFADKEIGIQVRKICYHSLLKQPSIAVGLLAYAAPWYKRLFIRIIFPKLRRKMRQLMNINDASVEESKVRLKAALDRVSSRLENNQFLVGNYFSRADISVAALLAPLCRPEKYGLNWPIDYPDELQRFIDPLKPQLVWVEQLYQNNR